MVSLHNLMFRSKLKRGQAYDSGLANTWGRGGVGRGCEFRNLSQYVSQYDIASGQMVSMQNISVYRLHANRISQIPSNGNHSLIDSIKLLARYLKALLLQYIVQVNCYHPAGLCMQSGMISRTHSIFISICRRAKLAVMKLVLPTHCVYSTVSVIQVRLMAGYYG